MKTIRQKWYETGGYGSATNLIKVYKVRNERRKRDEQAASDAKEAEAKKAVMGTALEELFSGLSQTQMAEIQEIIKADGLQAGIIRAELMKGVIGA